MAMDGFVLEKSKDMTCRNKVFRYEELITASELVVQSEKKFPCIFCCNMHYSGN